jgi:nitrite reductase/ring-hydroxylating ferredoxin subunit
MPDLRLCPAGDLVECRPLRVHPSGNDPLCVYLIEGTVYVSEGTCTHGGASLADDGELEGFNIICTWHGGAFDVRTGEATSPPCVTPLKVYPASIRDGDIWISVDTGEEQ